MNMLCYANITLGWGSRASGDTWHVLFMHERRWEVSASL